MIRTCKAASRALIVSGTKSVCRTRTSRPFRKSARSSIAAKNLSTSSDQRRGQGYARGVTRDGKEAFLGPRVVETVNRRPQPVLRNADPDLPGGHLLDRVRFVEDDEVVREKIAALAFLLLLRRAEQHEEQGVIDDDHVRGEQPLSRLLEEAIARLAARLGRCRCAPRCKPASKLSGQAPAASR